MLRSACLLLLASSLALGSAACASSGAPPSLPPAVPPKLVLAAPPPPATPPGTLPRVEVDRILTTQGPVWLLRQVITEPAFLKDGKFAGWRMVGLPEDWSGIEVRPGDVITRVNGLPVEKPEQFWEVWASVARVTEVRIDLMRDGAPRQVILPIDGAPSAETAKALGKDPGSPRAGAEGVAPAHRSIQLGGASAEATDDDAF